jgi:hypothetical protein
MRSKFSFNGGGGGDYCLMKAILKLSNQLI